MVLKQIHSSEKEIRLMQRLSLGQALAHLEAELKAKASQVEQALTVAEKAYFQALKDRYQKMTQTRFADQVLSAIPDHSCTNEIPYLEENSDFFLAHVLLRQNNNSPRSDHEKHSAHFNACYKCFLIYCRVMGDYLKTSNEIVTKTYMRGFNP